ncbi:MAG: hypothetical protein AMXMBFR61_25680 [Fimbriimonadales bacterium]
MTWPVYLSLIISILVTGWLCYSAFWSLPREARRRLRDSLRAVSHAVECRANHRLGRSEDIAALALAIGHRLKLSRRKLIRLEMAAYLRDLGLTAIPYSIINTPPEERTPAEQATYDTHTERGAGMVALIPSLRSVSTLVRDLDAWWDGSKGPHLPKAIAIPIEARILAAAAEFGETAAQYGQERAIERLAERRGTQFDPMVVDLLLELEGPFGLEEEPVRTGTHAGRY